MTLLIFIIGATGIIAQTIVLRELLVAFLGNELTLGLILGAWMLGEAIGGLIIGKTAARIKDKKALLIWLFVIFAVSAVVSCAGARIFKPFFNIPAGQGIGTGFIFLISFLITLPVSFSHGGLFVASCSFKSVPKAYAYETLGNLLAGVLLTWLLIPHLSHFQIIIAASVISAGACIFLFRHLQRPLTKILLYPLVAAVLLALLMQKPADIEQYTLSQQYPQGKVLDYRNSVYGNCVVVQKHGQRVFFYNGVPAVTTPVPDVTYAAEFGHLPLAFVENPKEIMVIGSGLGGMVGEILKEPVTRIDYCQQDRLLVRMLWKYPSRLTTQELTDKRLNVIHSDARSVLARASQQYDAIYIGTGAPADLASNRYFTAEFFKIARSRLKPNGVFSIWLPGSLSYLSPQVRDLNFMIINGLKQTFKNVLIIPGDYNIILAADDADLNADPAALHKRLQKRKIKVPLLNPAYLKNRFDSQWLDWFNGSSRGATGLVNTDDRPCAVYQVLVSWNKQFSKITMSALQGFLRIRMWMLLSAVAFAVSLIFALRRFNAAGGSKAAVIFSISSTGFFGMAISLLLIFAFQSRCGYLYQIIGALTAMFMAGAACGSLLIEAVARRFKRHERVLAVNDGLIALFCAMSFYVVPRLEYGIYLTPVFLILLFLAGLLVGSEFPLAVELFGSGADKRSRATGAVFFADLAGGVAAAFFASIVLLPLAGGAGLLVFLAALKSGSCICAVSIKNLK